MKLLLPILLSVSAWLAWGAPAAMARAEADPNVADASDITGLNDFDPGARPRGGPGGRWRGPASRPFAGIGLLAFSRQMFRPVPEDFEPLRPGEGDDLMSFAKERLPALHEALAQLQERNPERFRQRLEDSAPRLRHLQRVYEHNPKIGGLIRMHVENMMRVQRDVRTLRTAAEGSNEYARAQQAARERLAENVRLEIAALENLVEFAERERDTRTEQRAAAILEPDANLTRLPPRLRELVTAYRAATDDAGRTAVRAQLSEALRRIMDDELTALRTRLDSLRADGDREIEQRLQRLLAEGSRDPNHPGRPPEPPRRDRP